VGVDTSVIGKPTGSYRVRVDRGPVEFFATAVKDDNPIYHDPAVAKAAGFGAIPAPPTFSFAMQHMGRFTEEQPPDPTGGENPMHTLMGALFAKGGMVLHGEQEFNYFRPVEVGDVLLGEGTVLDVYEKESKGSIMTFIVIETAWRDEATGEPVLTEKFNLIHRRQAA
jgi:acyl dehydratase